jgi:hypothetical protein
MKFSLPLIKIIKIIRGDFVGLGLVDLVVVDHQIDRAVRTVRCSGTDRACVQNQLRFRIFFGFVR